LLVWFIPLADVRGLCMYAACPLRKRAISERLRGVITTRHYTNPRLPLPYLTFVSLQVLVQLIALKNFWRDQRCVR